jgi:hypothetical protein
LLFVFLPYTVWLRWDGISMIFWCFAFLLWLRLFLHEFVSHFDSLFRKLFICPFINWIVYSSNIWSSLYILNIHLLSDEKLTKIFSCTEDFFLLWQLVFCLFVCMLLWRSFLIWCNSSFQYFSYFLSYWGSIQKYVTYMYIF